MKSEIDEGVMKRVIKGGGERRNDGDKRGIYI